MELADLLRKYRKDRKLSVRAFAEILTVNKFRLEKWEKGIHPNYEDGIKIKQFFGVKDFQKISEDFLETFKAKGKNEVPEDLLTLKNQLLEEKDKRIYILEETINLLKEALGEYESKKKG